MSFDGPHPSQQGSGPFLMKIRQIPLRLEKNGGEAHRVDCAEERTSFAVPEHSNEVTSISDSQLTEEEALQLANELTTKLSDGEIKPLSN